MDPSLFPFLMSGGLGGGAPTNPGGVRLPVFRPLPAPVPVPLGSPAFPSPGLGESLTAPVPPTGPLPGFEGVGRLSAPAMDASMAGAPYQPPGQTAASVAGSAGNAPEALSGQDIAADVPNLGAYGGGWTGAGGGPQNVQPASLNVGQAASALQNMARGIQAPTTPVQTIRTPPPPQMAPVGASGFVNLLSSLGFTPQDFLRMMQGGR